jgi:hypothetical protein
MTKGTVMGGSLHRRNPFLHKKALTRLLQLPFNNYQWRKAQCTSCSPMPGGLVLM